jgi:hypothetical protein
MRAKLLVLAVVAGSMLLSLALGGGTIWPDV